MNKTMNLQMFAGAPLEAVQGKQIVYLFRPISQAAKAAATLMAFSTEGERTKTKEADSTATKSGSIRTPGVAEVEISCSAVVYKGDKLAKALEKAMDDDEIVECWEVNLAEETSQHSGKFAATYFQGYITEITLTSSAEDMAEYSITYAANGNGATGEATVSAEQQEMANYVFKDVTKESPEAA